MENKNIYKPIFLKQVMKRGYVLGCIVLLLSFQIVVALETQVDIQTQPNKILTIRFQDNDGKGTLANGAFIDQVADANGKISVTYSSDVDNYLKVSVGGNGAAYQFFRDIKTGWIYSLDFTQSNAVLVQGETTSGEVVVEDEEVVAEEIVDEEIIVEEIEVVEEVVEETNKPITGLAIEDSDSMTSSKKIIYGVILVVLIVIIILVFLFLKKRKSKNATSAVKFREKKDPVQEEEELEDAERRIKEAEREIKEIRHKKSALEEAEKKFEEDKRRLEELKRNNI